MSRPVRVWTIFAVCFTALLAVMAWASAMVMRVQRQALIEENVRFALWRMDSALAPIFVEESSRPYFHYSSFYPAERAYDRMFAELGKGDILVPSPLLTQEHRFIRLHFQIDPDGAVSSPQVPRGAMWDRALADYVDRERVEDLEGLLGQLEQRSLCDTLTSAVEPGESTLLAFGAPFDAPDEEAQSFEVDASRQADAPRWNILEQVQAPSQELRNFKEFNARSSAYSKVAQQQAATQGNLACVSGLSPVRYAVTPMAPVWVDDALVLARRVSVEGREYLQGCWLDWDELQASLRVDIEDLLPDARLVPAPREGAKRSSRTLVSLPVEVVPGEVPEELMSSVWPVRTPLAIAWVAMLLAAVAVACLLFGTLALSERRGAFVSAVTHELRTPLTTFRMYTDMLAEQMVPDEAKRRRYLETLRAEAVRLTHMVENVLAFARLEKGRAAARREPIATGALVEAVRGQLAARVEGAGLGLDVEVEPTAEARKVLADVSAVEQILMNLVDNACKHGGPSAEGTVQLSASSEDGVVLIEVRDHGPGIPAQTARRLFRPFSKSAEEAAASAPGVGLGLALSRRLARAMGGDLRLGETTDRRGARFVLSLPLAG